MATGVHGMEGAGKHLGAAERERRDEHSAAALHGVGYHLSEARLSLAARLVRLHAVGGLYHAHVWRHLCKRDVGRASLPSPLVHI